MMKEPAQSAGSFVSLVVGQGWVRSTNPRTTNPRTRRTPTRRTPTTTTPTTTTPTTTTPTTNDPDHDDPDHDEPDQEDPDHEDPDQVEPLKVPPDQDDPVASRLAMVVVLNARPKMSFSPVRVTPLAVMWSVPRAASRVPVPVLAVNFWV